MGRGIITTVAGDGQEGYGGDGGPANQAKLSLPTGVAVDNAGNLYVADALDNRVREVHAGSGIITTVAGRGLAEFGGDGGPATQVGLNSPSAVAVDDSGNLFIADSGNNRVREVHVGSGVIATVAGNGQIGHTGDGGPATRAALSLPEGVAVDGKGNLYIADTLNNRVREVYGVAAPTR